MKNAVAWGLAVILAAVVLGGGVALVADYQTRLPERERSVMILPECEWGVGRDQCAAIRSALYGHVHPHAGVAWPERYRLGIITVRIESPAFAGPPASEPLEHETRLVN
jgi:hypothetical protein